MKWFLDRKIGAKQILSFASVLSLTILLAAFALVKLASVRAATVDITEHQIPAMQSLSDLRAGLFQYRISEMSYVFTEDPDERSLRMANMQKGIAAVTAAMAELDPQASSVEERKLLAAIQQDISHCQTETQTILDMIQSKKTPDAIAEVQGSAQGNFTQTMDDIQAELDFKVEGATEASRASARTYHSAQGWVVGMSVFSVALGLFLAVFTTRLISGPVQEVVQVAQQIAAGDLTHEDLSIHARDEIGELAHSMNEMQGNLRAMIGSVSQSIERIAAASEELSANAAAQAEGADAQNDRTNQVAIAMQEMSMTVVQVAENSEHASEAARKAADTARQGGLIVEDTLAKMHGIADSVEQTAKKVEDLGRSSHEIGEIIGTIDDIADQTNLLALNAAIEAARAGEQGRGFAVVADEVRKLAERTRRATKEIAEMIQNIQRETRDAVRVMHAGTQQVQLGVESTTRAGASLREIIQTSEAAGCMVAMIATAASEQRSASNDISSNMEQIAAITQSSAAGAQESARAAHELSSLAMDLQGMVGKFKIDWNSSEPETPSEPGDPLIESWNAESRNAESRNAESADYDSWHHRGGPGEGAFRAEPADQESLPAAQRHGGPAGSPSGDNAFSATAGSDTVP